MGRFLPVLIAITCVCVIAAVGWWGRQQYRAAQDAAELQRIERQVEGGAQLGRCETVVEAFDKGDAVPAERLAGKAGASDYVNGCRALIKIRDIQAAK